MEDVEKSEKFQALARYIENYDYNNLNLLMFPKEDGKFLLEACKSQIKDIEEKFVCNCTGCIHDESVHCVHCMRAYSDCYESI